VKGLPFAILAGLFVALPLAAAEKPCIGRIVIIGNTETPASFIQEMVAFKAGDRFQYPLVRLAERHLAQSGRFVVDAERGIRPTVRPLKENDPGPVVDLIIVVQERPRNAVVPAGFDALRYRSVLYTRYAYRQAAMLPEIAIHLWRTYGEQ
jgi:hypothetical protein